MESTMTNLRFFDMKNFVGHEVKIRRCFRAHWLTRKWMKGKLEYDNQHRVFVVREGESYLTFRDNDVIRFDAYCRIFVN